MASSSSRTRSSGPVLRSLSPSGRFCSSTTSNTSFSSSSSAFASSTSSSFYSPSSTFFNPHHDHHHHNQNNPRSASPTRVNIYNSPSLSSSVRFSIDHRSISPNRSFSSNVITKNNRPISIQKKTCMCSPTSHPGSFRCSLHKNNNGSHNVDSFQSNRHNMRMSAMKNSVVRIGGVEGEWVKRALTALIRPSSHHQKRRAAFQPRSSRLSVMSKAERHVLRYACRQRCMVSRYFTAVQFRVLVDLAVIVHQWLRCCRNGVLELRSWIQRSQHVRHSTKFSSSGWKSASFLKPSSSSSNYVFGFCLKGPDVGFRHSGGPNALDTYIGFLLLLLIRKLESPSLPPTDQLCLLDLPLTVFEYFSSHQTPEGQRRIPEGERRPGELQCAPSEYFLLFDVNNDGHLSIPESSFSVAFKMFDIDNNGEIDKDEFKKVMALM
ncbi:Calcium uptake 1, mitochondrial [Quillaja saponaria]|uniref:Calcium uptake 1, mitochondrial n=1 Tax=Quillaja saponaria TaxID=32244 RepID=A0AAD7LXM5_QUISA|nr:Calcium uptake 1, mitochondrial [Quillaja saponaria]